jgi:DNA ligase 1
LGKQKWRYIELAQTEVCKDTEHLERFFQDIIDKGGEGIILRDPSAPYQPGRAHGYLKHKVFEKNEFFF